MTTDAPLNERLAAIERELEKSQSFLARKRDVEELKVWLLWRLLIGVAIIQGIIAAAIVYILLERMGPALLEGILEALGELLFG